MNDRMNSHFDEVTGGITGITVYIMTHFCDFSMLQIHAHPIASEVIIDAIRLLFTVAAAGIGYLVVHWLKRNVTGEEVKTQKKKHK